VRGLAGRHRRDNNRAHRRAPYPQGGHCRPGSRATRRSSRLGSHHLGDGSLRRLPTWHDKQTHKTFVRSDSGKCLHYYFYFQDARFGLVYLGCRPGRHSACNSTATAIAGWRASRMPAASVTPWPTTPSSEFVDVWVCRACSRALSVTGSKKLMSLTFLPSTTRGLVSDRVCEPRPRSPPRRTGEPDSADCSRAGSPAGLMIGRVPRSCPTHLHRTSCTTFWIAMPNGAARCLRCSGNPITGA
jgi:hypothetical protein